MGALLIRLTLKSPSLMLTRALRPQGTSQTQHQEEVEEGPLRSEFEISNQFRGLGEQSWRARRVIINESIRMTLCIRNGQQPIKAIFSMLLNSDDSI